MDARTSQGAGPRPAARRLSLVTSRKQRTLERDAALERVVDARRRLVPRSERFAHLKRLYD